MTSRCHTAENKCWYFRLYFKCPCQHPSLPPLPSLSGSLAGHKTAGQSKCFEDPSLLSTFLSPQLLSSNICKNPPLIMQKMKGFIHNSTLEKTNARYH